MKYPTAVVFAYADVGVRCLETLLSGGVDVLTVVTHTDDTHENRWFGDVAATARDNGIACLRPAAVDDPAVIARLEARPVDFVFAFYFRQLLPGRLLELGRRGALNMHGSLLPKYRGRAPINWAILRGERETGATLHYMVPRADAGDIVDQQSVPILANDTALDVTRKVTVAAEIVLARALPALIEGTAPRRPQPLLPGQYFGRRRPEDGRIDWKQPAQVIHDLVRAVAPPFPGAFTDIGGERWWIHATRCVGRTTTTIAPPALYMRDGRCHAACVDGNSLEIRALANEYGTVDVAALSARLDGASLA